MPRATQSPHTIYLFSPFFFPEEISTGRYNTFLAQKLTGLGYRLQVITSHPLFPSWRVTPSSAVLPNMRIFRGGKHLCYPSSPLFRRLILEFWFTFHSFLLWSRSFSVLYLSNSHHKVILVPVFPPSLFFAFLSFFLPRSTRRVGIVHDLQSVYMSRTGIVNKLIAFAIHAVESRAFNSCNHLVFLSNSMMKRAISSYSIDPIICSVCHPFVTLSDSCNPSPSVDAALGSHKFNIVYSGALGDKQEPDHLMEFLQSLYIRDSRLSPHVFSAGPHFKRLSSSFIYPNVSFHDLVPSVELSALYTRSFVQIIPQAFGTGDGSLPSKLPNLLYAGVPIFAICDPSSELGYLITSLNAGFVSHHWSADQLVSDFIAAWELFTSESHDQRRDRLAPQLEKLFGYDSVIQHITLA